MFGFEPSKRGDDDIRRQNAEVPKKLSSEKLGVNIGHRTAKLPKVRQNLAPGEVTKKVYQIGLSDKHLVAPVPGQEDPRSSLPHGTQESGVIVPLEIQRGGFAVPHGHHEKAHQRDHRFEHGGNEGVDGRRCGREQPVAGVCAHGCTPGAIWGRTC